MPIVLRPVEAEDVEEVVALSLRAWEPVYASMASVLGGLVYRRVYPDRAASQAAGVRRACDEPDTTVTVAIDEVRPVGFVALVIPPSADTGEVDMIAVDPPAQSAGVGKALMEHAVMQIRAAGCTLVTLSTGGDLGHAPARALYESTGFTPLPLVRYYREV